MNLAVGGGGRRTCWPDEGPGFASLLAGLSASAGDRLRLGAPMSEYTAMRTGGPADALLVSESVGEISDAVRLARASGVPCIVLGGGCNVLVSDAGIRGLVIVCRAARTALDGPATGAALIGGGAEAEQTMCLRAEAGASLASIARDSVARGFSGLEWASGLPGSVGGAVVGNAGAFEGDVAGSLITASVLAPDGTVCNRSSGWFGFGYRVSRLKTEALGRHVVLAADFRLQHADPVSVASRAREILAWRRERHPVGHTMGSTFKNPPGSHAGYLVEQAGLRGCRIGGAEVSPMHGNFFMNVGGASSADVSALITHVRAEVRRQFGIELELEIEMIGDWVHP